MRSGAAKGHTGYFHETALYDTDDEFLSIVVPFITEGVTAGEPTLIVLNDANADLVRSSIGEPDGVRFIPAATGYQTPATTIRVFRDVFAEHASAGAEQIRALGDVPHPGHGVPWDGWARYEATANHAFDAFPVFGLCPYDTRVTPDFVIDEAILTHPHIGRVDGSHTTNPAYTDPATFLAQRVVRNLPRELGQPVLQLDGGQPRLVRHAVTAVASGSGLEIDVVAGLELAVGEVVTNAVHYGVPPVTVRVWTPGAQQVVVTITDAGPGIANPFAGLLPATADGVGGRGLWIAHQTCADVAFHRDQDGFTVTLTAGRVPM